MSSLNTNDAPWPSMSNKNKILFYMNDKENYPLWLKKNISIGRKRSIEC